MIEEIVDIDKDTNLKNEVVAAYGEVLRKLKASKSLDEPIHKEREAPLINETKEGAEEKHSSFSLADLKQYINQTIYQLETALLIGEKKLADLDKEINDKHAMWQKEEESYLLNRNSKREQEEKAYLYQRDLQREKERHQYELAKHDLEMELKEHSKKMQEREEDYKRTKEKEAWILAKEQEYCLLQEKIAQFPQELKQAVINAEKGVKDNLVLKYEYEIKLLKNQMENERHLHEQNLAALQAKHEQTVATLKGEIAHLESLKYSFNKIAFNPKEATS